MKSPLFTEREKVCLDFAEQFAIQSSNITDDDVKRLSGVLSWEDVIYFIKALNVLEQLSRSVDRFRHPALERRPDDDDGTVPDCVVVRALIRSNAPMATTPRIPADLVAGFAMMAEGGDSPAARIAIPTELSRLAAIPIMSEGSFEIDPVVHECIRLFNANYNGCTYCQNARQAVAVQAGLNEDMVSKLMNFEQSDLPPSIKAALRIANAMHSGPQTMTQEIWDEARKHYSEQEVVDIVLLAMHGAGSKVAVTLGLEPGPQASSRLFFPAEDVYGGSPELKRAVEELERKGVAVRETDRIDYKIDVKTHQPERKQRGAR